MADSDGGGGSGFMGVLIGALLVGVLVLGFFVMNGGMHQQRAGLDVKIDAPQIPAPSSNGSGGGG